MLRGQVLPSVGFMGCAVFQSCSSSGLRQCFARSRRVPLGRGLLVLSRRAMAIGGVTGLSRRGFLPPLFGNLHSRSVQWGVHGQKTQGWVHHESPVEDVWERACGKGGISVWIYLMSSLPLSYPCCCFSPTGVTIFLSFYSCYPIYTHLSFYLRHSSYGSVART